MSAFVTGEKGTFEPFLHKETINLLNKSTMAQFISLPIVWTDMVAKFSYDYHIWYQYGNRQNT